MLCERTIETHLSDKHSAWWDSDPCPNNSSAVAIIHNKFADMNMSYRYWCSHHVSEHFPLDPDGKVQWDVRYGNAFLSSHGITLAIIPLDGTIPIDFWDRNALDPIEYPLFAEIYREAHGSVPVKHSTVV